MKTFKYTRNHKEDEAYMQEMCGRGFAAVRLVEGLWTFEPCKPGQYTYRMAYLRGMTDAEVEAFTADCASKQIVFVSRYSFWAIFRSEEPFNLYSEQEEIDVCEKIYRPMPIGAAVSWFVFLISIFLIAKCSRWFLILTVLVGIYGFVCTRCALSYGKVLKQLC